MTSYFTHLICPGCDRTYSPKEIHSYCLACTKPLLAEYDLESAGKRLTPGVFGSREGTLWRYRELLPVFTEDAIVSLGEGWTPLIEVSSLGNELGVKKMYIK